LLKTIAVAAEYKLDAAKREVTGYASVFNNVDGNGDIVLPGAYTKTLQEDLPAGRIKVKRNHERLIGRPVHAEQDSKGLLTVSRISQTPLGDETLTLIDDGVIDRMSIGYRVPSEGKSYATVDGRKVRKLSRVVLDEWSYLDDPPANDDAVITGVKSIDDVCRVIDSMSYAASHLRALQYVPPDIAERLRALLRELGPLTSDYSSKPADTGAVRALLSEMQSYLSPAS